MVWQRLALNKTFKDIAENLCVHVTTVKRTVDLFELTGDVCKKPYPSHRLQRKLTPVVQVILLTMVIEQPGIKLRELQASLAVEYGVELSQAAICGFLHKSGFSYQKMMLIARQRDEELRMLFAIDVSLYDPEMLIFIDETGADRRNVLRRRGYSIRGQPAKSHKLLCQGQRISVIAAMSAKGVLDCKIVTDSVTGDTFYDFVLSNLLAHLQPFDGSNTHCVVILDNASIHHTGPAVSAIEETGALVQFLPPYSPDYNPIEEAFSKVKTTMKILEETTNEDIKTITLSAFAEIATNDCKGWINDSMVYNKL